MFKKGDKVVVVDASGSDNSYVGQQLTLDYKDVLCWYFEEVGFGLFPERFQLVEPPINLSNKKINVKRYADEQGITLEQAHKEIQEWLFENGYAWKYGGKIVDFTYIHELSTDKEEKRLYNDSDGTEQELTFTAERSVKLTPVEQQVVHPPVETIELNGKKYDKSELEKALQHIKPLEE